MSHWGDTTGVAPSRWSVPGGLWVPLLSRSPGPPHSWGIVPAGDRERQGPFLAPLLGRMNPGQPPSPSPGCPGLREARRRTEQSSLPEPVPVNKGGLGTDSCLAANGPQGQPGHRARHSWTSRSTTAGSHPQHPSCCQTQPQCRRGSSGAGGSLSKDRDRCGGTAPVLPPQWAFGAHGFAPSRVGLAWRDGDPAVSSPQGTSSTAWHPPATTPTRSRVCRHRRTQPTHLATRSTATPRAPSPAFPPATSAGRRR